MMLIDETTTADNRQEVATNLVKLFLGQGLVEDFLNVLFKLELEKPGKSRSFSISEGKITSQINLLDVLTDLFLFILLL